MKENIDLMNHEKDAIVRRNKSKEEQIFINELKKEMKKEMMSEVLILFAIYVFFMDCDF